MYTKQQNKFNIAIIGDADSSDGDVYAKEMAERNFERLNTLFGVIESKLESCTGKEGAWFLQNVVFNTLMRMNIKDKETFLEGMASMYDMIQSQKRMHETTPKSV